MVDVSQSTVEELEKVSEEHKIEFDKVSEKFKERYEELDEKSVGVSDEDLEEFALRKTRPWAFKFSRTPSNQVELLTVGGTVQSTDNGDMFTGSAIVDENPDQENAVKKLASVIVYDEDLTAEMYSAFSEVGNVVIGEFNVSEGDIRGQAEVSDVDDTEIEVVEPDEREELISEIRDMVPSVSVENIADNISETERLDNGNSYPIRSDIYRIEGTVYDSYRNPDSGFGAYTVRDQTVFDDQDLVESSVYNKETASENETPGLGVLLDANDVNHGSESVIEFFGTVEKNNDGEVQFNGHGLIANDLMATEFDGYEDSEDDEPDREELSTENVDRTTI